VTRGELAAELAATLGARHEARFIVQEILGGPGGAAGRAVTPAQAEAARALASRRLSGEPLQYLFGHWAFRTLDLLVDRRVLIPRPETEQVVGVALGELAWLGNPAPSVVDAGTGSGAIALSMAVESAGRYPAGRIWATDASADALDVARANWELTRLRCGGAVLAVTLAQGCWLDPLPAELKGSLDLIVSNPPYVSGPEWDGLPADVRCEPRRALVSADGSDGTPGLADAEAVLDQGRAWLGRPGSVVIELAPHQADPATRLARAMGYTDVRVTPDLAGLPRAVVARQV
jgi:release factor glutamine methyltransferase